MTDRVYEYVAGRSHWAYAIDDMKKGWARRALWYDMAMRSFKNRYKGAIVGAFWLTITTAITATGLGLLYGRLFGFSVETHLPYVTIGIVTWALISGYMTAGCEVFVHGASIFKEYPMPLSLFPFRLAVTQFINYAYRCIALVGVLIIFPATLSVTAPIAILGIVLIFWIGFWVSLGFGILNARYRDFGQMVFAGTTFFLFMTPIFWRADRLGEYSWIVDFNPFYHLINIVRGPILGEPGVAVSFLVAGALAVVTPVVSFYMFGRLSHRLPYWC